MCECPGDQCHCEVLTAYARECERAGYMVHNWREPTGCKNVTSFRYSGTNQISREDSDDDNDIESSNRNDVLLSTDAVEEISKNKFVSADVGDFLPACSPNTAVHCTPDIDIQEQERRPRKKEINRKKGPKDKQSKQERREKRRKERKEKQRQKKRQERMKKKRERRRLKRLREKERRESLKQNRKKNKQLLEEEEEETEEYEGVSVTQVLGEDGDTKRKLSWTKFERGKPPPFEFLLNSSPALGSVAPVPKDQIEEEDETEDYQVDDSLNYGATTHTRVKPGARVPLPLFEGAKRGQVKDSDSLETGVGSNDRTSSDPANDDLPSQRDIKNWKTTRRRNEK
jgi:hypothetical protein